jgi:hypothetical protein
LIREVFADPNIIHCQYYQNDELIERLAERISKSETAEQIWRKQAVKTFFSKRLGG